MSNMHIKKQTNVRRNIFSTAYSVLDSSSQGESLQRKADMANNAAQRVEAPRPNNTGMPDNLKAGIESLSGFSMDDVRVHYNSSKPATVQALAYTQGTDIHVAPGQEKHLPHEVWHVAQQMAGRVSPTTNINGMPVNDNAALEHEADVMGEKALQCKTIENLNYGKDNVLKSIVQRITGKKTKKEEEKEEDDEVSQPSITPFSPITLHLTNNASDLPLSEELNFAPVGSGMKIDEEKKEEEEDSHPSIMPFSPIRLHHTNNASDFPFSEEINFAPVGSGMKIDEEKKEDEEDSHPSIMPFSPIRLHHTNNASAPPLTEEINFAPVRIRIENPLTEEVNIGLVDLEKETKEDEEEKKRNS